MAKNPTVLKQIDVMIYEQRMFPDFQNALSTISVAPQPTSISQRGVLVEVVSGDVLASNCEVLINTAGGNFNLSGKM